jgi:hypothetical protein
MLPIIGTMSLLSSFLCPRPTFGNRFEFSHSLSLKRAPRAKAIFRTYRCLKIGGKERGEALPSLGQPPGCQRTRIRQLGGGLAPPIPHII